MFLDHYMRITTRRERERLAREYGTTVAYLYQLAGGHRRAGAALTLKLERATFGAVCRCDLRPDLFPPEECLCRRSCACPRLHSATDGPAARKPRPAAIVAAGGAGLTKEHR